MWHRFEADVNFLRLLVAVDDQIAEQVRAAGCVRCSGPLHRGDYPRKPRGLLADVEEAYSTRRSLCCGRCRKRSTPPSVRFLGRKVYVGWLVFVAVIRCALAGALMGGARIAGVPRRTVLRWEAWWTADFPGLPFWQMARARFTPPPPSAASLPLGLVDRFDGGEAARLHFALAFVAPVTTVSASWVQVDLGRAEDGILSDA